MGHLEKLEQRINRTNHITPFADGTIADAIASRDCLESKIRIYRQLEEAASTSPERHGIQEIKYIRVVDLSELEKKIDHYSKEYR